MKPMSLKPQCLLFDFGGVLVQWDGVEPLVSLTAGRLTPEQARRFWLESEWVRRFETGRCNAQEFAIGAVCELQLEMAPEAFLEAFTSWDRGPFPGSLDLLVALKPRFTLACLTNNNPIHWAKPALQELAACFHRRYVSFEMGLMKPDREVYERVIADLALDPGVIVVLDDNPGCVSAAGETGMRGFVAKGPAMVIQILGSLDIAV